MPKKSVPIPVFKMEHKQEKKSVRDFHSHAGYEIVWIKSGEAKYIFQEKVYHLKKDHVLFFKSTEFHKVSLQDNTDYDRVVIMFTEAFFSVEQPIFKKFEQMLDDLPTPHALLHLFLWRKTPFEHIIGQLLQEVKDTQAWEHKEALELYLTELLLYLNREMHSSFKQEIGYNHPAAESSELLLQERILKEINNIWDTNWQLEDLADRLHFNKYYLCHFFKKEFDMTIHQYILQRRIYEAKKMLIDTDISINDLAVQVGFSTASNFIRCFKKYVHMTPKQFRNQRNLGIHKV
ncbi:AraC family transcriptional regulator [Gracilibacillus oryzae]|uniref:AraC family transcriptional regulator n=1 Tax=Gracilibacillus oryzae TaxID=1672701 RepID=A0A7C8GRH6_9BACI|nr:AraC family transcriptional regulator [Gracilibacillus oryzae]KAB8127933.1 AraC family transcriptional regulator [Gracilibacillus oryzae]